MSAPVEVTFAGSLTLRRGEVRVGERSFSAPQLRLTTAVLVLERGAPVSRTTIIEALWSGAPPDNARVAVSNLVSALRRRLGEVGIPRAAIRGEPGRYLVDVPDVRVDLEQAEGWLADGAARLADGDVDDAHAAVGRARSVLSRPVLPGVESPWLDAVRDRVSRRHLDSLLLLARCRVARGDHDLARRAASEALEVDPLREDGWRVLMGIEVAADNSGRALQVYEQCRTVLSTELGVDPSPATRELHAEILRGAPESATNTIFGWTPEPDQVGEIVEPYRGLRAYGRRDAALFFGRDAEVQDVVDRLAKRGIVAVVGPSGVGKSSLVRAGLLPALARGAIADSDTWPTVVVTPGSEVVKTLAVELAALDPGLPPGEVRTRLDDDHGLHDVAGGIVRAGTDSRILVVVDQFEEVFTLGASGDAEHLAGLLTSATGRMDARTVVVVVMRADFYPIAAAVPGLDEVLSRSQYVVPAMSGDQLERIVSEPARRAGGLLEPGLLGAILGDVSDDPGTLPLLQHLLYELWQRRIDRVMTRHAYDQLGGVAGALAHRAEVVYTDLSERRRGIAKGVLLRGVQPARNATDTRRPVPPGELEGLDPDPERVEAVVRDLVDARLLTASHDPASDERIVELAHEAMIDHWPRLAAWVADDRDRLQAHHKLAAAAREWDEQGRHDDWLLTGRQLDDALDLPDASDSRPAGVHLSSTERELVARSRAARDERHAREVERRDRERRVERRSSLRLRALVGVLVVVSTVAGGFWFTASRDARAAAVRELAAESAAIRGLDPTRALELALAAHDGLTAAPGEQDEVADALHGAVAASRIVAHLPDTTELLAVDDAGDRLVAVSREGDDPLVELYDTAGPTRLHRFDGIPGATASAAFSPDGATIVVGTAEPFLRILDTTTGREVGQLQAPAGVPSVDVDDVHPDGGLVAGHHAAPVGEGGRMLVWDLGSGAVVADIPRLEPREGVGVALFTNERSLGPVGAVFSPDGARLAILPGTRPGITSVVDVRTWEEAYQVRADLDNEAMNAATWGDEGVWLAVAGTRVRLATARTGAVQHDLVPQDGVVGPRGIGWMPDRSTALFRYHGAGIGTYESPERSPRLFVGTSTLQAWQPFTDQPTPVTLAAGDLGTGTPVIARPDRDLVFTGAPDGDGVRIWDVSEGAAAEVAWLPSENRTAVAFSPNGGRLVVGGDIHDADAATVVDTASWEEVERLPWGADREGQDFDDMDWHPDGSAIAAATPGGVTVLDQGAVHVRFVGPAQERDEDLPETLDGSHGSVSWTSDGDHLAMVDNVPGQPPVVAVMDHDLAAVSERRFDPDVVVREVRTSPDRSQIAIAHHAGPTPSDGRDAAVEIWDWQADEVVATLPTQPYTVAWSPDGDLLAVGEHDGTVSLWDSTSGSGELVLDGHTAPVRAIAWTRDGSRLATTSEDRTVRVWDPSTGRQLQEFAIVGDHALDLEFSPDGHHLVAATQRRGVWVWTMQIDELAAIAEARLIRALGPEDCRAAFDPTRCLE